MKDFRRLTWVDYASIGHGKKVPLEQLDQFREEEKKLMAANAAVVRALQSNNIPARRPEGDKITMNHTVTDSINEVDQWRNINLLPVVQVKKRRTDVVELEGYCARFPWGLRMRLVTSGVRCPVEEVAQRIEFIHEAVRRLRERKWFSRVAELISIGIEFTIEEGPEGHLLYHVHAHLIYRVLRQIPKALFRDFLRRWQGHFRGCYCPDSGRIRDLREACKYPCKSGDLLGVIRAGELPALFNQLAGKKLFQCYGGMRMLRADLRATGEQIKRRSLASKDLEAVTHAKKPLVEYVRVAPQPTTRVRRDYRAGAFEDRPRNVFLGWTKPIADKKTGQVGVQEVWLNADPRLSPEELRKLRGIERWTPPRWRQQLSNEEPTLQVHTNTSSACLFLADIPPEDEGEVSPFSGSQEPDSAMHSPVCDEPDFNLDYPGIFSLGDRGRWVA